MSGQLRFNFINSNDSKFHFGCKLKHTDKPDEIVDKYSIHNITKEFCGTNLKPLKHQKK